MGNIRAKAVCLFRQDDRVLLMQSFDPAKNEHYLMPIGGGIEFGELAIEAIQREVMEEIQQPICNLQRLHILENIFTFDAQQGHEIVFIYRADFVRTDIYQMEQIRGMETSGLIYSATWYSQIQLESLAYPVYPKGIEPFLFQSI